MDKPLAVAALGPMAALDVNLLFGSAERAFAAGRLDEAARALDAVESAAGEQAPVLHLRALVARKRGDLGGAELAFARALALSPRDPQLHNNLANLLGEVGETERALEHYDRALAANPRFTDARFNRALLLARIGRDADALAALDELVAAEPGHARAHSARGASLRSLARFAEAAAAYDRAIALAPNHAKALEGRARVALESGDAAAPGHYSRALAANPQSRELMLGTAEAREASGDGGALAFLEAALASEPGWIEGQQRLSEMRSEHGEEDFARGFRDAAAAQRGDRALHYGHWRALALGGRYDDALGAIDAAGLAEDDDVRLMRAVFLSEAGQPGEAGAILERLPASIDADTARARNALRLGDAGTSARLLETVVAARPSDIAAWAHLSLAWRLTGDSRHAWLCEQPGLYSAIDLPLGSGQLGELADLLRGLHRTHAHPIGQSLRGGTQTRGRLFWRSEPLIAALHDAIMEAIRAFVAALPPREHTHPLLRHRDDSMLIAGSWSVRLAQSGFHINHIHPQGVLSSACYIALPESLGDAASKDGWLELGSPPVELGLPLGPLATIEPRPGRLALFPSYLYHGTRPFRSGERLTVAFDIVAR